MAPKTYLCANPACSLGTLSQPGRFSGGIPAEQLHILTGQPLDELEKGKDFGEGFCPNCGQRGKAEK